MFFVRFIIIIAELLACYILQTSVLTGLSINNVVPDLLMIVVVAIAYIKGSNAGIIYGFFAGILMDLTYGNLLGYFALIYMFCGFFCGVAQRFYRKDDNITPLILCASSIFLSQSVLYVTEFMLRGRLEYGFYFVNIILINFQKHFYKWGNFTRSKFTWQKQSYNINKFKIISFLHIPHK